MSRQIKIKLNLALKNFPAGKEMFLAVDKKGVPTDSYWARRLKDAELDNCIEIIREPKSKGKKTIKQITEDSES